MATLAELATSRTHLDDTSIDHLLRLTASWSLLSDLSFSDLLLMAKVEDATRDDENFVVLEQMRPNNRATLIDDDLLGTTHPAQNWPLVRQSFEGATRVEGELELANVAGEVPVWCVPVRHNGIVIAIMV